LSGLAPNRQSVEILLQGISKLDLTAPRRAAMAGAPWLNRAFNRAVDVYVNDIYAALQHLAGKVCNR
jgi:hypothetical protein